MSVHNYIRDVGKHLLVGETLRTADCPDCGRSEGFTITRVERGYLYNCYRAKCSLAGGFVAEVKQEGNTHKHPPPRSPYTTKISHAEWFPMCMYHDKEKFLCEKFHLRPARLQIEGICWCPQFQRVIMPLRYEGVEWGFEARFYPDVMDKGVENKTANVKVLLHKYGNTNEMVHTPAVEPTDEGVQFRCNKIIVLVEDVWSSMRLAQTGIPAAALCGTNLKRAHIELLSKNTVVVTLDNDAILKTIKIIKDLQGEFPNLKAVPLRGPDVKNMTERQFDEYKEAVWNCAS